MIPLGDKDLDALSVIAESDILIAYQAAVKAMSKLYKNLLLTLPEDVESLAFNTEPNARSEPPDVPIQ